MSADLTVQPLGAGEFAELVELFGTRGDPSWCWCQFFVTTGNSYGQAPARGAQNREALRRQVRSSDRPLGVLACHDDEPVGWLALGPRPAYRRLTTNPGLRRISGSDLDDDSVWATTCFVVKVGRRRQGVSDALLRGGIELAKDNGATAVEGHPVDTAGRTTGIGGATLYHGIASTFERAGFVEIGRTGANRPVMRLSVQ